MGGQFDRLTRLPDAGRYDVIVYGLGFRVWVEGFGYGLRSSVLGVRVRGVTAKLEIWMELLACFPDASVTYFY